MLYFLLVAIGVCFAYQQLEMEWINIPFLPIGALSTALAIFLGFKNNAAYDRWWEGRKIWGLLVNYSRAWGRQVTTFIGQGDLDEGKHRDAIQELVYRHIAFVHSLRIFIRQPKSYNKNARELYTSQNTYKDAKPFLDEYDWARMCAKDNPPNFLLQRQSEALRVLADQKLLTEFRLVAMDQTLTEFNNIQDRSERIKNTPFPRYYSFFPRLFVYIHNTLLPFSFVDTLGWLTIPLAFLISFIFLALDQVGERHEDPFENRPEDVPISALSRTIEINLREQLNEYEFPEKVAPVEGVMF